MSSKKLASLLVDMQANSAQLRSELQKANGYLKGFGSQVDKLGASIGAALTVGAAVSFGKAASEAFMRTEAAALKLGSALKNTGYASKMVAAGLKEQSAAMQSAFGVSDDMVTQMQTLMVTFGVAPKDIEKTTKAILDFSALTGEDAVGATSKLVESINSGSLKALKSFGISVADAGDKSKTLAAAVDAIAEKFGGAAAAKAEGFAGRVERVANAWEDMQKGAGSFFDIIDRKLHLLDALAKGIEGVSRVLSGEVFDDRKKLANVAYVEQAQKRVIDAQQRVDRYNRRSSDGSFDYGVNDRSSAAKELSAAQKDLAEAARATALVLTGGRKSGDLSGVGQSAAAQRQFGISGDAIEKITEETIAKAAERGERAKHAAAFRKEMAKEISADRLEREIAKIGQRSDTFGAMERDWAEKEKYRQRREAVEQAVAEEQKKLAESAARAAERLAHLRDAAADAAMGLAQQVAGKLGRAGGLFNSALSGAQSGMQVGAALGPKGAAVGAMAGLGGGVLMDLVTSSDAFARTIAISDEIVKGLSETLGEMIAMYNPILKAGQQLIDKALQPFERIVAMMSRQIENLVPALNPLVTTLVRFVDVALSFAENSGLLENVFKQANRWGRILFDASKFVAENMLSNALGMVMIWNSATTGLRDALRSLADFDVAGTKPFADLHKLADGLNALTASSLRGDLANALDEITKMTYGAAEALGGLPPPIDDQTKAIEKSLGAWLNVPEGYRVAIARFDAMNPVGAAGGSSVSGTWANNAPVNITIVSEDPRRIWTKIQPFFARDRVLRYGTEADG